MTSQPPQYSMEVQLSEKKREKKKQDNDGYLLGLPLCLFSLMPKEHVGT